MNAGHLQRFRVLRERHRVTSLGGQAVDLLGGLGHVEQRQDAARDEPARVRGTPLVDVPVVVGLDHHQVDLAVRALVEHLAGEPGEVGEVQARQLAAGVHVADPLVDVEAARPHLVVAAGVDVVHLARLARHGVQAHVASADVAVVPLLDAVGLDDHPRRAVLVLGGDVGVEHVGRLGDVVVHADQDQIVLVHAVLLGHRLVTSRQWRRSQCQRRPSRHAAQLAAVSPGRAGDFRRNGGAPAGRPGARRPVVFGTISPYAGGAVAAGRAARARGHATMRHDRAAR